MPSYETHRIFKIAETQINPREIRAMLQELDSRTPTPTAVDWWRANYSTEREQDPAAMLITLAGRICYKSFGTGLNANLTKVRNDAKEYVKNILDTHHGSVLEHATVTFALCGISRVITHEIVRHRAGVAYSQESMRFVRVDSIRFYYPDSFIEDLGQDQKREVARITEEALCMAEQSYQRLTELLLSNPDMPFSQKKKITSAMRRLIPDGILTDIVMTANHRAWRHMIEMRTAESAEEEIRKIFFDIGQRLCEDHYYLYQDMKGINGALLFENSKI